MATITLAKNGPQPPELKAGQVWKHNESNENYLVVRAVNLVLVNIDTNFGTHWHRTGFGSCAYMFSYVGTVTSLDVETP